MADELNPRRTAVAVGAFAALVHVIWAAIVALGFGQGLVDWILGMHFVKEPVTVLAFDAVTAATLVVLAFVIGAAAGTAFAKIWNWSKKYK